MVSYLFQDLTVSPDSLIVEGWHKPSTLTTASGAWVGRAGSAMLDGGEHPLNPLEQYVWFCIESGSLDLKWKELSIHLEKSDACVIPAGKVPAVMSVAEQAYVIWLTFDGPLAGSVVRQMGALLHTPIRQKSLPSQAYLAKQIVQVMVRHSGTDNATYQLQHLMYGLLASRWGQPVAMDAMLSHEIAKVVDALRAGQYKDNFSPQALCQRSRNAASELCAVLQDGAGQGITSRPELYRPGSRRGSRNEGSLSFLQAVQEHRGHQPVCLCEAGC